MYRIIRCIVSALILGAGISPLLARGPASFAALPLPDIQPAELPFGVQFDLPSKITGRTYRISLYRPQPAPPMGGWPVIYVLDSRSTFATAASQVQLRTSTGQGGAVVVGIGYPDPVAASRMREFDLTPSAPLPGMPASGVPGLKASEFGGAALFHRFMIEELRPVISGLSSVNPSDQSLIGYSKGGLFALGVLFDHPNAYRNIVAGSPSIWWNNRELLRKEAGFAAAVVDGKVSTRVLITSNECEQAPEEGKTVSGGDCPATPLGIPSDVTMVDDAEGLASRLARLGGASDYRIRYVLFAGETHLTGIAASTSRGVAFTFNH